MVKIGSVTPPWSSPANALAFELCWNISSHNAGYKADIFSDEYDLALMTWRTFYIFVTLHNKIHHNIKLRVSIILKNMFLCYALFCLSHTTFLSKLKYCDIWIHL